MKSTDIARSDRELKRARKKAEYIENKLNRDTLSVGDYINQLHEMMFFDAQRKTVGNYYTQSRSKNKSSSKRRSCQRIDGTSGICRVITTLNQNNFY